MTEIAFHFNAPGKLGYACRLLRKATGTGAKVLVTGERDQLRQLDVDLWTFSPLEFLAHCVAPGASEAMIAASPVVLADSTGVAPHHEVLVNLGGTVPQGFERFERLIEVVSVDEDDRQLSRRRWKHYADRGYQIKQFDLAQRES